MAGVVYEYHASAVMERVFVGLMEEMVPTKAICEVDAAEVMLGGR